MAKYQLPINRTRALEDVEFLLKEERDFKVGKYVILRNGKYAGRRGVCSNVIIEEKNKKIRFEYCIYVIRADGSDVLNTDIESRSYLPENYFVWT